MLEQISFSAYNINMERFAVSTLGKFLVSREEGKNAFTVLSERVALLQDQKLFCDFIGVTALSPSFCDEVFGEIEVQYPGKLVIDESLSHALRVAFETVEETRGVKFTYGGL